MENKLDQVVHILEDRLQHLLEDYVDLKKAFNEMHENFEHQLSHISKLENKISVMQQENVRLKNANALLGSDEYKRETKLKINALVKEIDQCIAQLT